MPKSHAKNKSYRYRNAFQSNLRGMETIVSLKFHSNLMKNGNTVDKSYKSL
ncbi:MAG: hypothetical protein PWQ33_1324 [Pseudothermotoga sp.]|nr:hypothetical protein [Pseudothermotoga sp.]